MSFDTKENTHLVRFLSNQQIDSKKKKLKKGKRVFYDNRNIDKCSIAFPNIQNLDLLKKIAKQLINRENTRFKALAQLETEYIIESGQDIEIAPELIGDDPQVDFSSHGHIKYQDFGMSHVDHMPPDFELILDDLQKKAEYLLDENLDHDEFQYSTYVIDPEDQRNINLILKE